MVDRTRIYTYNKESLQNERNIKTINGTCYYSVQLTLYPQWDVVLRQNYIND